MIAVTGLMRSGTTPLAMMLHQSGVTMGVYQRFPLQNPASHFEWEDAALADALLRLIVSNGEETEAAALVDSDTKNVAREIIVRYVKQRMMLSGGKPWGVKTPFLLPFVHSLRLACEELDEPLTVLLTQREYDQTVESIRRQVRHLDDEMVEVSFVRLTGIQERLASHWYEASEDAEIFDFKETRERPRDVATRLAELAGVSIDVYVATRGIRAGGM